MPFTRDYDLSENGTVVQYRIIHLVNGGEIDEPFYTKAERAEFAKTVNGIGQYEVDTDETPAEFEMDKYLEAMLGLD